MTAIRFLNKMENRGSTITKIMEAYAKYQLEELRETIWDMRKANAKRYVPKLVVTKNSELLRVQDRIDEMISRNARENSRLMTDEQIIEQLAKESTAPDKETPDWMLADISRGFEAGKKADRERLRIELRGVLRLANNTALDAPTVIAISAKVEKCLNEKT